MAEMLDLERHQAKPQSSKFTPRNEDPLLADASRSESRKAAPIDTSSSEKKKKKKKKKVSSKDSDDASTSSKARDLETDSIHDGDDTLLDPLPSSTAPDDHSKKRKGASTSSKSQPSRPTPSNPSHPNTSDKGTPFESQLNKEANVDPDALHKTLPLGVDDISFEKSLITYIVNDPDCELSLEQVLSLFQYLAYLPVEEHAGVFSLGVVTAIAVGMSRAVQSEEALTWGCAALWNLSFESHGETTILAEGGLELILTALRTFPESPEVLEYGFGAISSLCCGEEGKQRLMSLEGHYDLANALSSTLAMGSLAPLKWTATALSFVAESGKYHEDLMAVNAFEMVLGCILALVPETPPNLPVSSVAGEGAADTLPMLALALDRLARHPPAAAMLTTSEDAAGLVRSLAVYSSSIPVLEAILGALASIMTTNRSSVSLFQGTPLDGLVRAAMGRHPSSYSIHAHGHRILSLLSSSLVLSYVHWLRASYNDIGRWQTLLSKSS